MKGFSVILPLLAILLITGCAKDENKAIEGNSGLVAIGQNSPDIIDDKVPLSVGDGIVFTGDDILWFNSKTREIKFKDISSPLGKFSVYEEIRFELSGEVLFKALTYVSDINSQIFSDLVLYYNLKSEKFYLHDSYPMHIFDELAKENKEKRAEGWKKFIDQLKSRGQLKE